MRVARQLHDELAARGRDHAAGRREQEERPVDLPPAEALTARRRGDREGCLTAVLLECTFLSA